MQLPPGQLNLHRDGAILLVLLVGGVLHVGLPTLALQRRAATVAPEVARFLQLHGHLRLHHLVLQPRGLLRGLVELVVLGSLWHGRGSLHALHLPLRQLILHGRGNRHALVDLRLLNNLVGCEA